MTKPFFSFLKLLTEVQRGNSLHCTAKNSIPIPNFQVRCTDRNFVAFSSQQVLHYDLEVKYQGEHFSKNSLNILGQLFGGQLFELFARETNSKKQSSVQYVYASAVPKNLGLGLNFWQCSEDYFLSGRPLSVTADTQNSQFYFNAVYTIVSLVKLKQMGCPP